MFVNSTVPYPLRVPHLHPALLQVVASFLFQTFIISIHYFVAFFRSSRCLFNSPFRVCLTQAHPWTRTVVGVRPSNTYRLIITNGMETDKRTDMEKTVILWRLPMV